VCPINEIVDVSSKVSGTKIKFQQVPEGVCKSVLLPPAVEEMTENVEEITENVEEMTGNVVLVRDYS
jgi:hypothetical protein